MSGVEAAGFVLAVLPLIISAIEDYEATFQPFVTFCRYAKELRSFQAGLGTQKQLFQNHCIILLSRVEAEGLLEERSDLNTRWKSDNITGADIALEKKLAAYLGSNYDTCFTLIQSIEETLTGIQEETKSLKEVASEGTPVRDKVWRQEFSQRLKFSFSKPKLRSKLDSLRDLNSDFLALRQTIECLQKVRSQTLATPSYDKSLDRLQFVQVASLRLHEALANVWSCSVHKEHSVNICMNTNVDIDTAHALEDVAMPRIRFDMAFTFLPNPTKSCQGPIWLEIETSKTIQAKCPKTSSSLLATEANIDTVGFTASLKRRAENFLDINAEASLAPKKKDKKSVPFLLFPTHQDGNDSEDVEMGNTTSIELIKAPTNDLLPELYRKPNLCLHLQQCHQNPPSDTSTCLGVLQRTRTFNHILYRRPALDTPANSISLETVLSNLAETKPTSGISCLERVRLARSLATAVLEFHSTPWLPETWRSRNIHFYEITDPSIQQQGSLNTPLLNATFSQSHPPNQVDDVPQQEPCENVVLSPIRNNILFGLGLMMMELGFETTMKTMHRSQDLKAGKEHDFTDYLTSRRLKKSIATPLGKRYGRITQKCLDCEFGVGEYDLGEPSLQAAFYKEVVQELSDLEKTFKRLDID